MGNTPIKLKISAAVHPLGAPMPLINRSNLTTCAMRHPIAHRPLTCPQNEERTKNQLHDGLYHNILCMSIWIEHDFVHSDNRRQYEPRLRRMKFYGTGGRGEPREPPPDFPCFALHRAFYKRKMPSVCTLDKCRRRTARAISLFRESYRSGRQCAFARLPLKSRIAQPGNTRSEARAQELARSGLEFGLERVVFADGNSYNIFVRVLWNFLSHT